MKLPGRVDQRVIPWLGEQFRLSRIATAGRAPASIDPWHQVGDPGEPGYQNQWGPHAFVGPGTGLWPLQFCKDGAGFVHMRGWAQRDPTGLGAGAAWTGPFTVFQLPVGYRPTKIVTVPTQHALSVCQVSAAGEFTVAIGLGNGWASLDGMQFRAEA